MTSKIDDAFLSVPLGDLASAALDAARAAGATYADIRVERTASQSIRVKDRSLEGLIDDEDLGLGVRMIVDGAWGFASRAELTEQAARTAASEAAAIAKATGRLNTEPVALAPEPVHEGEWVSEYEIDPFSVDPSEKVDRFLAINAKVLDTGKVDHVDFGALQVLENKFFANLDGTEVTQQRVRTHGQFQAVKVDPETGEFETMRTPTVPGGQGWEYFTDGYDFEGHADEIGDLLEEKMKSPSIEPGRYDLVIEPSNLWLTIHESIGHATELDRALGYEAAYAGTSFATLDKLNELQYGTEVMNVTGDRVVPHGLATVAYDDEGVAAQSWDIIKDGVLVGYQLNRQMALKHGMERSNGCAFADSPQHVPLQRMPNVSLKASPKDISIEDLIGGVEKGIYVVGDKSWSIDMQRYNFQFTGQRLYEISSGKIRGQLRDVAYQATTTEFWNAMEAVGGESTYLLGGAFNCGKGQPGQVAPVSHGSPAALFRQINILNTRQEQGS